MSVVGATLTNINERKTMSHKYNPTAQELRDGYSVAYGDLGDTMLIGALFGYLQVNKPQAIETIYKLALDRVREDMEKAGQL